VPTTVEEPPDRLAALAAGGTLGVSLTHPLKAAVLPCSRASRPRRGSPLVNTVGLAGERWWGESTDARRVRRSPAIARRSPAHQRVLLLGAGGAARSVALALLEAGAAR